MIYIYLPLKNTAHFNISSIHIDTQEDYNTLPIYTYDQKNFYLGAPPSETNHIDSPTIYHLLLDEIPKYFDTEYFQISNVMNNSKSTESILQVNQGKEEISDDEDVIPLKPLLTPKATPDEKYKLFIELTQANFIGINPLMRKNPTFLLHYSKPINNSDFVFACNLYERKIMAKLLLRWLANLLLVSIKFLDGAFWVFGSMLGAKINPDDGANSWQSKMFSGLFTALWVITTNALAVSPLYRAIQSYLFPEEHVPLRHFLADLWHETLALFFSIFLANAIWQDAANLGDSNTEKFAFISGFCGIAFAIPYIMIHALFKLKTSQEKSYHPLFFLKNLSNTAADKAEICFAISLAAGLFLFAKANNPGSGAAFTSLGWVGLQIVQLILLGFRFNSLAGECAYKKCYENFCNRFFKSSTSSMNRNVFDPDTNKDSPVTTVTVKAPSPCYK